jgi:hypothetical protein
MAKAHPEANKAKPEAVQPAVPAASRGVSWWREALGMDEDTPLSTVLLTILLALLLAWHFRTAHV